MNTISGLTTKLVRLGADQATILNQAMDILKQKEDKVKAEAAAKLGKIASQREGLIKLTSLFGGKGKATSLANLDVESAGMWRSSENRRKPSRTSLVMHILFCIVSGETTPELEKSQTFKIFNSDYHIRPQGQYFYAGVFIDIAKELGYTWDCSHVSNSGGFHVALQVLVKKGYLRRQDWGEYVWTGKAFPGKG